MVSEFALETSIATSDEGSITVRGMDLIDDLIGHVTYTEMVYLLTTERMPSSTEVRALDACLVTLMEHGLTPSAIVARLIADSVPGETQVAMAAGLLGVGGVFVGTMEQCAQLLVEATEVDDDVDRQCDRIVSDFDERRQHVPGFGHRLHHPDDPRAQRLLGLADDLGIAGSYVNCLMRLGESVDRHHGRHITINATGAIAALMLEIQIPVDAFRSLAVVSRCGGLPGHLRENRKTSSGRKIWRLVDDSFSYTSH